MSKDRVNLPDVNILDKIPLTLPSVSLRPAARAHRRLGPLHTGRIRWACTRPHGMSPQGLANLCLFYH